ncbi:MAG: CARDB domain-containing protein [Haloferacaceae archaeon]
MRRALLSLLVCSVLVGSTLAGAPAVRASSHDEAVAGSPDLGLTVTRDRIGPSETGRVDVTVSNSGDVHRTGPTPFVERVTTARNVKLTVLDSRIDAPIEITSGPVALGAVADGRPRNASFTYETGANLTPGTYRIPIRVTYDYTSAVGYDVVQRPPGYENVAYSDSSRRRVEYVTLVVDDRSRFDLSANTTDLYAGDTGALRFSVRNAGTETARNATIRLSSGTPGVYFGDADDPHATTSVLVPTLAPGESRTATVRVGARSAVTAGTYPVDARVVYENANGVTTRSDPLTMRVRARPERRFALRDLRPTTARVGDDDILVSGTIVNRGPATAHDAVVTVGVDGTGTATEGRVGSGGNGSDAGSVRVTSGEASVGDLAPGESRRVRFRLAIPRGVEPGDRVLAFGVDYQNGDGDLRHSRTPIRRSIGVGPEVDRFAVRGIETNVSIDASNRIVLSVNNTANVTYRDVVVRLSPSPPFSSVSPEAYVASLSPGERARLQYELTVADDAVPSTHGVRVTVVATEPDGDTYRSDPTRVRVEIRPQRFLDRDWAGVLVGGVAVAVVLGVGYLLVERR